MRIALGIVKLFPEGGLQRDCIRLARILVARGHDVTIFTSEDDWPLDRRPCRIVRLPVLAYTNHGIDLQFAKRFAAATAGAFDRVIGFNKLTGLDFYYCADPSIVRARPQPVRTVAAPAPRPDDARRAILRTVATHPDPGLDPIVGGELSARLADARTADHRAATVDRSGAPAARPANRRPARGGPRQTRASRMIDAIWLWVGAQAHIKGLDRVLAALQSEPETTLLVAGIAADSQRSSPGLARIGAQGRS